jgi:glycosyltransferase involved in cell wall biosynthesis
MPIEENEISAKSFGGTEMVKRGLAERIEALEPGLLDDFQIICSRVREIDESKIRIYWLHDLPGDPETSHLKDQSSRDRFHHMVFCNHWQYQSYQTMLGVPYDHRSSIIDTPFEPTPIDDIKKSDSEIRMVYTSTPQRGLSLLVPVFEKLAEKYDNIYLDVFSSFKIYGWEGADKQFESVFEKCRQHPRINYHGFASNEEVRSTVANAHIFAYPSIWPECNSRSLIEAMSSKAMCVHPDYAGLVDTSGKLTHMYHGHSDANIHAKIFHNVLEQSIDIINKSKEDKEMEASLSDMLTFTKIYADNRFSWDLIVYKWIALLKDLKKALPTEESRKLITSNGVSSNKFVYQT